MDCYIDAILLNYLAEIKRRYLELNTRFHYLSLHKSQFYKNKHDGRELPLSDHYSDCLIRLPLFYELSSGDIDKIVNVISS